MTSSKDGRTLRNLRSIIRKTDDYDVDRLTADEWRTLCEVKGWDPKP